METNAEKPAKMVLEAIKYTRGSLQILDQLQLPHASVYLPLHTSTDAWHAIREMRTRGVQKGRGVNHAPL